MDISTIDATKVNTTNGLLIGDPQAPIKVIEFINVRCPYCKKWFNDYDDLLTTYVNEGKIQRVIKLFDKEKESLQRGNVMHHHIDYRAPEKSLADIRQMFATQDTWKDMSLTEVATYAETTLGLPEKKDSALVEAVIAEANAASIKFVPTIIIGDKIFDEAITKEELESYLNN